MFACFSVFFSSLSFVSQDRKHSADRQASIVRSPAGSPSREDQGTKAAAAGGGRTTGEQRPAASGGEVSKLAKDNGGPGGSYGDASHSLERGGAISLLLLQCRIAFPPAPSTGRLWHASD